MILDPMFPGWLEGADPARIQAFLVKRAALYATPDGHLKGLAYRLRVSEAAVSSWALGQSPIPPERIVQIEEIAGRRVAAREWFRPDLFAIKEGPVMEHGA